MNILDQPERINHSADWVYQEQCGCKVIFLGSAGHRQTKTDLCWEHCRHREKFVTPGLLLRAKAAYRDAELNQPPM